jgi:hypothetical protein
MITIYGRNFVAFAKLLARGNHPIGEAEHCPSKEARAVDSGTDHKTRDLDLDDACNYRSVRFSSREAGRPRSEAAPLYNLGSG